MSQFQAVTLTLLYLGLTGCATICDPNSLPQRGLGTILMCLSAQAASGSSSTGPTDRAHTCEEIGADITDSDQRVTYTRFSIEPPRGNWCLSTAVGANGSDRFSFIASPLLELIYPTGVASQEEMAHTFWLQGSQIEADNPAEISTPERIQTFMTRKGYLAEEGGSLVVDNDTVPGAACVWGKTLNVESGAPHQPSWTLTWIEEGIYCQHPDEGHMLVGIVFVERRRTGWNDPTPEVMRRYRDEAFASIRSLQFVNPE